MSTKDRLRGKPRGRRRDRDCHSCKARGIKCDLNRPQCLPCVRSGLPCGGYPQRVVWVGETQSDKKHKNTTPGLVPSSTILPVTSIHSTLSSHGSSSASISTPPPEGRPQTTERRVGETADLGVYSTVNQYSFVKRLKAFYEQIKCAEGWSKERGDYLSDEAIQLVSRIWDFARSRIQGYDNTTSSRAEEAISMESVRYQLIALMGLNEAMESAHPVALFGIATFAFFEVCHGAFGEWQCHLHGARSLLDFRCHNRADLDILNREIPGLTEIVAHLVWFDTMGTIIRGTQGLIFEDWHRETLNESFFAVVGCPQTAFDVFVKLAKLDANFEALDLSFLAMDQLLQLDSSDATDRGRTASAFRCTAAIAALGRIGNASSPSWSMALSTAVNRACEIIALIPPTSGFYIHLAATAYLAGINATTERQRSVVRTYWQYCRSGDFPHYPDGQERCEEKWRA